MKKPIEKSYNLAGIDCTITWERRKTTILKIEKGEVFIKTFLLQSLANLEKFVTEKRAWIIRKIDAYFTKYHRLQKVLNLEQFLLHGKLVEVYRGEKLILTESGFTIPENLDKKTLASRAKSFFIRYGKIFLCNRLGELSQHFNLPFNSILLSNARKKWGSCDNKKNIRLNWRLVLLPNMLQNYIMLHELCHTVHLNHSKDYWALMEKILPQYKKCKKMLKEFTPIMDYLY